MSVTLAPPVPRQAARAEVPPVAAELIAPVRAPSPLYLSLATGSPHRISDPRDAAEQQAVRASNLVVSGRPGAVAPAGHSSMLPGRGGQPLDSTTRAFMEPRFGTDLSAVRIHTGSRADRIAGQVGANAFTVGSDIAFASGKYSPDTGPGRRLLAHELTHVLQQDPLTLHRDPRDALDPANQGAWNWYDTKAHRDRDGFLDTVTAATPAAQAAQAKLAATAAPQTDEERASFEAMALTLTRLNAIRMVGRHRAELLRRKQEFEAMAKAPPNQQAGAGATDNPRAADLAKAIRAAAQTTTDLRAERDKLVSLRETIEAAVRVNAGAEAIPEEYQTLWTAAEADSTAFALQRLLETRSTLDHGGLSWGSKKVVLMDLRNDLATLRSTQISGIDLALALTYDSFPFLADLKPSYILQGKQHAGTSGKATAFGLGLLSLVVPVLLPYAAYVAHEVYKKAAPPTDESLLAEVGASFDRLLNNTDEAIVKVGSGGIHPLDLPGALAATRAGLPESLRPDLDRLKTHHEAVKFATEMALALGIAVLTGVTGGLAGIGFAAAATATGVVTAGVGVAQLGGQLKDMLDRQTLAAASTSPDGSLLGVNAPSTFEWTMFAVAAALTAADLGALAKEIRAVRPSFAEEPHLPAGRPEPHPPENAPKNTARAGEPEFGGPTKPGSAVAADANEARLLDSSKGSAVPTPDQLEGELVIVRRSEANPIKQDGYVAEVELPNQHVWRRVEGPGGGWCRFSDGRICVPGFAADAQTKQIITSAADVDRVLVPLQPRIDRPPTSVRTPADLSMWELYNEYWAERLASMRTDLLNKGQTTKNLPWTFEAFRETYTANPELIKAVRGRLAQGTIGNAIADLPGGGQVAQNLGISRIPNPGRGEVVYPDFVWKGQRGYTAVSSKERSLGGMSRAELERTVHPDLDEALDKYAGSSYVRRRGLEVTGQRIEIDEVLLNYPQSTPSSVREVIIDLAKNYRGGKVKISFFKLR
jgi:hypothetical protein